MLWKPQNQQLWDEEKQEYNNSDIKGRQYQLQSHPGDVSMLNTLEMEDLKKWAKAHGVKGAKKKTKDELLKKVERAIEMSAGNEILHKNYPDLEPMIADLQKGQLEFHTSIPPKPPKKKGCFGGKIEDDKKQRYNAKVALHKEENRKFVALTEAVGDNIHRLNWIRVKSALEGEKIYLLEWVHRQDWMHRKMQNKRMKPNPEKYLPTTIIDDLNYKLQLPASMYTAIWLLPLIDGRVFHDWDKAADDDSEQRNSEANGNPKKFRNILNQTRLQFIFSEWLPTIVTFLMVVFLQAGFLFYISEIVLQDKSQWQCYGRVDGGAGTSTRKAKGAYSLDDAASPPPSGLKQDWDSDNPKVLRYICLLTFLSEIFRVRIPQCGFNPPATLLLGRAYFFLDS
jgi:hypothetical protein